MCTPVCRRNGSLVTEIWSKVMSPLSTVLASTQSLYARRPVMTWKINEWDNWPYFFSSSTLQNWITKSTTYHHNFMANESHIEHRSINEKKFNWIQCVNMPHFTHTLTHEPYERMDRWIFTRCMLCVRVSRVRVCSFKYYRPLPLQL